MTPHKFFTGRALVFIILAIFIFAVYLYQTYVPVAENTEVNQSPPIFVWKYEPAETLNLDGIPNTDVFLEARYVGGKVERKLVDTVAGGCNDLPDSEEVQCYWAGLGYRYKVTKGEKSYLVERKTFEEGTPDYAPPPSEYETVAEFPL